jgi:protoporphyrinogen oxidase
MKIAVIGGGLTGLAAANGLAPANQVTLYECDGEVGGMAASYRVSVGPGTYLVTKTYHHIQEGDTATFLAIGSLGLQPKLRKTHVRHGFLYKDRVYGFSSFLEILRFPLPFTDKIRLAKFTLFDTKRRDWSGIAHLNARQWIEMTAGKRNFNVFFGPLLKKKFHATADQIPARWLGNRMARESASFLKQYHWLEGGFDQLVEAYRENIHRNGGDIRTHCRVVKIDGIPGQRTVITPEGSESYDAIVLTIAPELFLKIVTNIPAEIVSLAENIRYVSCICATFIVRGRYTDRYWINILDQEKHLSAIFQHSALYSDSVPDGYSVFYFITYLMRDDPFWMKDDETILNTYLSETRMVFPGFSQNIIWKKVTKFAEAEAISHPDFKILPDNAKDLYFAGIFKIFPKTRNMASAIEEGEKIAALIRDDASHG